MPATLPPHDITALVLAGGMGRRMGGADKGLQPFRGRPLVAHVLARLAPQVDGVLISANRNPEAYAAYGYPVLPDVVTGFAGPLAGIHAGVRACPTALLAIAPCDAPFLPANLVALLHGAMAEAEADIAFAETATGPQPTFALIKCSLADDLAASLAADNRRLQEWYRRHRTCSVRFDDEHAFANMNSANDIEAYRHD